MKKEKGSAISQRRSSKNNNNSSIKKITDNYNINDKDFTRENWRQQDAIYIYDGVGRIKDDRGYDGYTLVNLPWHLMLAGRNICWYLLVYRHIYSCLSCHKQNSFVHIQLN